MVFGRYTARTMAIHTTVILLALLGLNAATARRYHTLVKSEIPLDDLEQIDRKGNVYNIPLVPADEDIPIPDLEYGLRVIKVNRRPFADRDITNDREHSGETNQEAIHKGRHETLKHFHYTYTVPDRKVVKEDQRKTNKHLDDNTSVLPKKEIEQIFQSQKVNVVVVSQKNDSSKVEVKRPDQVSVTSSKKSEGSSKDDGAGASSIKPEENLKPEEKKKVDIPSKVELNLFVDKLRDREHHLFNPYVLSNYDLYKHIYNRFLVSEWNHLPHHLSSTPNVVNIYYDKRYMQNAPGSHSFIYGTPIEGGAVLPEPIHLPQPIHSFHPVKFPQTIPSLPQIAPHPNLVYLEQSPLVYPISPAPAEFQVLHQIPEELHELELKDAIPFHPERLGLHVEEQEPKEYFLPKLEVVNKFDEKTPSLSGVPQEKYGLPDTNKHSRFKNGCKTNCFLHATKFEYGVPILEVPKVQLPTSYEVPLY